MMYSLPLQAWFIVNLARLGTAAPAPPLNTLSDGDQWDNPIDLEGRQGPAPQLGIAKTRIKPSLHGCTASQGEVITQAWNEAGYVAFAHALWTGGRDYQNAMDMYMGTDSAKDHGILFSHTGPLRADVQRSKAIHYSSLKWSPFWSYAYFVCDESILPRKSKAPPSECGKAPFYSWSDPGHKFGWNSFYVVFCPSFYRLDYHGLSEVISQFQVDPRGAGHIQAYMQTRAALMSLATWQWKGIVKPQPVIQPPKAFLSADVARMAENENVAVSQTNAPSWAIAGLAIYAMQRLGLKMPPTPNYAGGNVIDGQLHTGNLTFNLTTPADNSTQPIFLPAPPDWFVSPVDLDGPVYEPSMLGATEMVVDDGLGPGLVPLVQNIVTTS